MAVAANFKVVGKAVATARGHYPLPTGGSRRIQEGETFDVYEGKTKATWFKLLETPKAAPAKPPAKAEKTDDVA